jgi:hypothetical protein
MTDQYVTSYSLTPNPNYRSEAIEMPRTIRHTHSPEEARAELKDVVGCMSCGLPMNRGQREIASDLAQVCPKCVDQHGHLKSYEEVFERLVTNHYMKEQGLSRPEAEKAARAKMAELPAWKDVRA